MSPAILAKSLFEQGAAAWRTGQTQRAMECFQKSVAADPASPAGVGSVAGFLLSAGQAQTALPLLRSAAQRFPRTVGIFANLGVAAAQSGYSTEAVAAWRQALAIEPNIPPLRLNLARLLRAIHHADEAEAVLREAIARTQNDADAWTLLATTRFELGDINDSRQCTARAAALRPADANTQHLEMFQLLFADDIPWDEFVGRTAEWGRKFAAALKTPEPHRIDRPVGGRLKVGYVAPFIANHVNTELIATVLEAHDANAFEVIAYCVGQPARSDVGRLGTRVSRWSECSALSDADLAERIRADGVDILVDLTLHMEGQRLGVFARKPAPVQMNYLAYPATAGLAAFDYRVTCPLLDPVGSEYPLEPEKLLRLPDTFWCYPRDTPPVPIGPPPSERDGFVTFGCLNAFYKTRDAALSTWARVLEAVPGSRLHLLVRGGDHARSVLGRLRGQGIDCDRVQLFDHASRPDHLARFNDIDVVLDTFPYGGHTTLHDALWMGVPPVVRRGDTPISRAGECILSHVDLLDLTVDSTDAYVALAAQLAGDIARRTELRLSLRERMLKSPLNDATRFARHLETGYRLAWQRWRDGQPPAHLTAG